MPEDEKVKQVCKKTGGPFKDMKILGYEEVKQVCTYTGVISTRGATGRLINGEEKIDF